MLFFLCIIFHDFSILSMINVPFLLLLSYHRLHAHKLCEGKSKASQCNDVIEKWLSSLFSLLLVHSVRPNTHTTHTHTHSFIHSTFRTRFHINTTTTNKINFCFGMVTVIVAIVVSVTVSKLWPLLRCCYHCWLLLLMLVFLLFLPSPPLPSTISKPNRTQTILC